MAKILVSYYSRTGNTEKIGNEIASLLKADVEKIIDKKDRSGSFGWILAGKDGMGKKETKIAEIKKDPSVYDLVVIGTPVWVNTTPAIRTYIRNNKSKFKNVAFFLTKGGSKNKVFEEMEEELGKKPKATLDIKEAEIKDGSYKVKIKQFTEALS